MTKPKKSPSTSETILASRRTFLRKAGLGGAAVAGSALAAPAVLAQNGPIKWRLQTYSGAPLGAHVIKPQIDAFNAAANGEMEIELYYADQLVPTGELFRAMQNGTIDAVQSDEATMASPVDISVFGGYFPFATRYSLDVPSLFRYYGLQEIWEEAYSEVDNVTWLSAGAWDPLHIFTKDPIRSLADMRGKRGRDRAAGRFVLDWDAHGLSYGIPREVRGAQAAGRILFVNLSRAVLPQAVRALAPLSVVHVTARPDVLARRLSA